MSDREQRLRKAIERYADQRSGAVVHEIAINTEEDEEDYCCGEGKAEHERLADEAMNEALSILRELES
jgi:hypothetical protein